ncbi:MAG: hypothetical protein AB2777_17575 [Candidatus Thiodiazotropha endolucinida]
MINEVIKSVKSSLYERVSSPLFGAFLISWIAWNYKFVVILFSKMTAHEKFDYIETFIYCGPVATITQGFLFPFITAVVFILVYPYPSRWLYGYWNNQQKILKEIKQKIEDETPLTIEESRTIRREMLQLESVFDNEIRRKDSELEKLKTENQYLNNELEDQRRKKHYLSRTRQKNSKSTDDVSYKEPTISNEKLLIIEIVANADDLSTKQSIIRDAKINKLKAEVLLGELENENYIDVTKNSLDDDTYTLTLKGKREYVNQIERKKL